MKKLVCVIILAFVLLNCSPGQWVRNDATLEESQQDYAECQNLAAVQAPSGSLSQKAGGGHRSRFSVDDCMKSKGYTWKQHDQE